MDPRVADVLAEARTWLGTPYHHHGRIKGVGVDCAQYLACVFENAGLVPEVVTGFYPTDWHLHRSAEMFVAWLERYADPLPVGTTPQPADVALFRYGRTFSHGAIMTGPARCLHSYIGQGVIETPLDEYPLAGRVVQFWRIR